MLCVLCALCGKSSERASGLEPEMTAWEAVVLPLHHARNLIGIIEPSLVTVKFEVAEWRVAGGE